MTRLTKHPFDPATSWFPCFFDISIGHDSCLSNIYWRTVLVENSHSLPRLTLETVLDQLSVKSTEASHNLFAAFDTPLAITKCTYATKSMLKHSRPKQTLHSVNSNKPLAYKLPFSPTHWPALSLLQFSKLKWHCHLKTRGQHYNFHYTRVVKKKMVFNYLHFRIFFFFRKSIFILEKFTYRSAQVMHCLKSVIMLLILFWIKWQFSYAA